MINNFHPVGLNVVRGALTNIGLPVKRIRTLNPTSPGQDWEVLEVEFAQHGNEDRYNWSPLQLTEWVRDAFASDVDKVSVEFRSGKWFARLVTEAHKGEVPLFDLEGAEVADPLTAEVGNFLQGMLDQKLDTPF